MIRLTDEEIAEKVRPYCDRNGRTYNPYLRGALDIAVEAQLKKVVEWGDEECTEHQHGALQGFYKRRLCKECWQALLEEVKGE